MEKALSEIKNIKNIINFKMNVFIWIISVLYVVSIITLIF